MKISRSTGYGLLALAYMARHADEKIIMSQTISKEYDIPLEYLLKIMQQMVRANILRSKRGPRGGFSLGRSLSKISMLDIIEAVEGPMSNQLNLAEQAPKEKCCAKIEKVYDKAIAETKAIFAKAKLSSLL